jgi:two-component system sensor histidine kinase UhpB
VTIRLGDGTLGFATIARDLTTQHDAADALSVAHAETEVRIRERTHELEAEKGTVTELLRRVVSAQEDERARIARDLHDSLGQQLTALRLALERHQQKLTAPDDALVHALSLTGTLSEQIDFLAWELRPAVLDDLGLAAALPRFIDAWSAHVGIPTKFTNEGFASGQLTHDAEVAFYRVAQEALNNVAKHAHAGRADVVLTASDGVVVMVVEDNGTGFDIADAGAATNGIGLASMGERAALVGASLDIESEAGKGTCVYLRAPFNGVAPKDQK